MAKQLLIGFDKVALTLDELLAFKVKIEKEVSLEFWEECGPLKSPKIEDLARFWNFFRSRSDLAEILVHQISPNFSDYSNIDTESLPSIFPFLEALLVLKRYTECSNVCEILSVRFSADLRLQDIRARSRILLEDDSELETNIEFAYKPFAKNFCSSTFDSLAFFEDGVYICCCNYIPKSIGSIAASGQKELWNSEAAQAIRASILNGAFEYCNKMVCPRLRNRDLHLRDDLTLDEYYRNIIDKKAITTPNCYPRSIELNEDPSCNLVCPSCRSGHIYRDNDFLKNFESNILPGVLDNHLNSFLIACFGEPFASSHYLRVLHMLDDTKHQIDHLVLYTNGILFTQEKWFELQNLHGFDIEVRISIDAASEKIYSILRPSLSRGGDWKTLITNLSFVSSLRQQEKISKFKIFFVVQENNYREMLEFVIMGKALGVDEVVFSEMQKYGVYNQDDQLYAQKAVHIASHPSHLAFQKLLQDPLMHDPIVSLHGCRL